MINKELKKRKQLIERYLGKCLPSANKEPRLLHQAMRYSVLSGGKRIRPLLALAAAEDSEPAMPMLLPETGAGVQVTPIVGLVVVIVMLGITILQQGRK